MDENEYKPEDWARLAAQVKQRRVHLDLTQTQVHSAGGPSVSVLSKIESSRGKSYDDIALARLEKILKWRPGSILAILRGEEPQILSRRPDRHQAPEVDVRELVESLPEDEKSVGQQILMVMGALQKEVAGLREDLRRLEAKQYEDDSDVTESESDTGGQRDTRGA